MIKKHKVKIIRSIWYVSLAMIWGGVLLLLVEFGALSYQIYIEHTNPFITALRKGTSLSANTNIVIIKKEESYYPEKVGGWNYQEDYSNDDVPLRDFLKSDLQVVSASTTGKDDRRYEFMGLSDNAKEAYTALKR